MVKEGFRWEAVSNAGGDKSLDHRTAVEVVKEGQILVSLDQENCQDVLVHQIRCGLGHT